MGPIYIDPPLAIFIPQDNLMEMDENKNISS